LFDDRHAFRLDSWIIAQPGLDGEPFRLDAAGANVLAPVEESVKEN